MKNIIVILIITFLTGCGGGSSDSGGGINNQTAPAVFSLNAETGPNCTNPTATSDYSSGDYVSQSCTWYCSPIFNGQKDAYVKIDFAKSDSTGGKWILESKFVSDGICP